MMKENRKEAAWGGGGESQTDSGNWITLQAKLVRAA